MCVCIESPQKKRDTTSGSSIEIQINENKRDEPMGPV